MLRCFTLIYLIWFNIVEQNFVTSIQISDATLMNFRCCWSNTENLYAVICVQVEPCKWRIRSKIEPCIICRGGKCLFNICVSVSLTPWFSRTVHCNFNGSLVRGHLRRVGENCDGQRETLPYERKGDERGEEENRIERKTGRKKVFISIRISSNTLLSPLHVSCKLNHTSLKK